MVKEIFHTWEIRYTFLPISRQNYYLFWKNVEFLLVISLHNLKIFVAVIKNFFKIRINCFVTTWGPSEVHWSQPLERALNNSRRSTPLICLVLHTVYSESPHVYYSLMPSKYALQFIGMILQMYFREPYIHK